MCNIDKIKKLVAGFPQAHYPDHTPTNVMWKKRRKYNCFHKSMYCAKKHRLDEKPPFTDVFGK